MVSGKADKVQCGYVGCIVKGKSKLTFLSHQKKRCDINEC